MELSFLKDQEIYPSNDVLKNVLGTSYPAYEELTKHGCVKYAVKRKRSSGYPYGINASRLHFILLRKLNPAYWN